MTKAKSKPKAKPTPIAEEPTVYILLSGKHSRRLPDGTSERFYPGDEIPDPSPQELAHFGDKIVSAEAFGVIVSQHAQAKQTEATRKAALKAAKAQATPILQKERDPEAIERGEALKEIREDQSKKNHIVLR